ncbi:putative phage abortive infection protein [Tenacibaculum aestuarii]|uniref:putative phage abortive infection protein n=1 Tax=Tenacibaculum aestuarii TaxID=362781 RepID=UPI0038943492
MRKTTNLKIYILIFFITALPWFTYLYFFYDFKVLVNNNTWSQFGSFIGGVSAALTLPLTLTFVYKTYISQKEIEKSTLDSFELNKFNSYFFELLKTFNQYRFEQMKFWKKEGEGEKEWIYGSRFFLESRRKFQKLEENHEFQCAYNKTIDFNNLSFEYYFRSLNTLLEWIENSKINDNQKKRYFDLIINSLTNDEKFFIKNINYLKDDWNLNLLKNISKNLTLNFDYTNNQE